MLARRRTRGCHQAAAPLQQVSVAGSRLGDGSKVDPGADLVSMAAGGATRAPRAPSCHCATGPRCHRWRLGDTAAPQRCTSYWIFCRGLGGWLVCIEAHLHVRVVYWRGGVVGPGRVAWLLGVPGELGVQAVHQALAGDTPGLPGSRATRTLAGILPATVEELV